MYSFYFTNKLQHVVYCRLSEEKLKLDDGYVQKMKEEILDINVNEIYVVPKEYISALALCGFCMISPGKTHAFSVQNATSLVYASIVYASTVWVANFPFDPKMYGCVAISPEILSNRTSIVVSPYNPEAVWLQAKTGDQLPSDIIKAGIGRYNEHLYFGRKAGADGGIPCAVASNGSLCNTWLMVGSVTHESGELLKNTGFELIRAKRGDPIPPNAVMTGVREDDGSLFVGKVGGTIPCYVTTEDGKIQSFVYGFDKEKRVANGEVMVLTR